MTDVEAMAVAIAQRWTDVRRRIERTAEAAGRDPATVRVVAVSKGFGVDVVRAALTVGLRAFGESRVQEAEPKVAAIPEVDWHLVGHLQSNKARRAVAAFATIDAVDSLELLNRLEAVASELGVTRRALLQVNLTAAPGQHGFDSRDLDAAARDGRLAAALGARHAVTVAGLMGIGPFTDDATASRAAFAGLRGLRNRLEEASGRALPDLSMGMSGDLEAAVVEGATELRLGTALFGPRPAPL